MIFLFNLALFLELFATGGFIVFIIKQQKWVFRYSYNILIMGFICHSISIGCQYYELGTAPILGLKSILSFFSWSIVAIYILLQIKFKLRVLGSFVAPFVTIIMISAFFFPWKIQESINPIFNSLWLIFHVIIIFIGDAFFAIAFLTSIMYLIQEYHIKKKRLGSFYTRLPSLATLDAINTFSLNCGFPLLSIGILIGSIYSQYAFGKYWQWDPKEVWALISWLFYAALIHQRITVGWQGRRAAIMSIICFCILMFTFIVIGIWFGGYHSFKSLGA